MGHHDVTIHNGQLTFTTANTLLSGAEQPLGDQTSRITFAARPSGYLLIWDAAFTASGEQDLIFGDQEEMGLGVRVATAITEKNGGVIRTSAGGIGAKATWGKTALWSDYSGKAVDRHIGILLVPDPRNFRAS